VTADSAPDREEAPFNIKLTLRPAQWKEIRSDMLLSYEEEARRICALNLMELQPLADTGLKDPEGILGMNLTCPDGCTYAQDESGTLYCPWHGSSAYPRQGAAPGRANPVQRILEDLQEIRFSMRYTEFGIHTRILIKR
jgi:hypothetical protein